MCVCFVYVSLVLLAVFVLFVVSVLRVFIIVCPIRDHGLVLMFWHFDQLRGENDIKVLSDLFSFPLGLDNEVTDRTMAFAAASSTAILKYEIDK